MANPEQHGKHKRSIGLSLDIDIEKRSLQKCKDQIDSIFKNAKEFPIDMKKLMQLNNLIAQMNGIHDQFYPEEETASVLTKRLIYLDKELGAANLLPEAKALFDDLEVKFFDGSIASGFDDIFEKINEGMMGVEFAVKSLGQTITEQIQKRISDAADEASRLGTSLSSYDDTISDDSEWDDAKEIARKIQEVTERAREAYHDAINSAELDEAGKIQAIWGVRTDLQESMQDFYSKEFSNEDSYLDEYFEQRANAQQWIDDLASIAEDREDALRIAQEERNKALFKEQQLIADIFTIRAKIANLNANAPKKIPDNDADEDRLKHLQEEQEYQEKRIELVDQLIDKTKEYDSLDLIEDRVDFESVQKIPKRHSAGTDLSGLARSRGAFVALKTKAENEAKEIVSRIQQKQEETIQETVQDTVDEIEEQLDEIKQEEPKKKRSRKKKEPESDPNQIGMFDDTTEQVSEKSTESLTEEKQAVQEVDAAFEQAADAKGKFEEANKEAGKSADHSSEKFEDEAEALDDLAEAAESAADSQEKLDKRIHRSSDDGSFVDTKVTSGQDEDKYGTAYKTVSTTVTTDSDGTKSTTKTETWDYRKYEKELKTERQKIERAQKSMKNYLAQFQSKTLQHGTQFDQFNKLSSISIESLEDIEKAESLIKELEAAYNSTVASFRKGSASLNPFVNAINGAERLETSIEDIGLEIKSFSSLPSNVSSLYNDMLSKKAALDSVDKNSATYIQDYAQAYGDLKVAMNAVIAAMRQSRKENKLVEQMVLQTEAVDKARRNLDLYESQLAKNGALSEENQAKIRELREELELIGKEGTGFDLKLWTNEFNGFKSDVQMIQNYLSIGAKAYAEDLAAARREQEEIYKIRRKLAVMDGDDPEYQVRSEDRASHQTNYDALFNKLSDEDQQKLREQEDKNEREIQLLMRQQEKKEEVDLTAKEDVRLKIDEYKTRLLKSKELTAEARHEIELLEERLRTVGSKTELEQIISDFDQLKLGIRATQNEADAAEKEYQEAEAAMEKVYQLRRKLALLDKDDPEYAITSRDEQEATAKYGVLKKGLNPARQEDLTNLESWRQEEVDAAVRRKQNKENEESLKEINKLYKKQEESLKRIWALKKQQSNADDASLSSLKAQEDDEWKELEKITAKIESDRFKSVFNAEERAKEIEQYYNSLDGAAEREANRLRAKRKQRSEETYGQNQYNSMVRRGDAQKGRMSALGMDSDIVKDAWNVYIQRLSEYNQLLTQIQGKSVVNKEDKNRLVELQGSAELAFQEVKRLIDEELKLRKQTQEMGFNPVSYTGDIEDIDQLKESLKTMFNVVNKADVSIGEFNKETGELSVFVKQADGEFKEYIVTMSKYSKTMNVSSKSVQTFSQNFKTAMAVSTKKLTSFVAARIGIEEFFQQFRQGLGYVKDVDTALTELKKVTDATASAYDEFIKDAGSIGRKIGSTITDFTNATADFARLGNNISDSTDLATAATVYKNVGDGIDDISTATESIISTQAAFKNEVKDGMTIVDKFNAVGKYLPSDIVIYRTISSYIG